jgi:hypothetical protein
MRDNQRSTMEDTVAPTKDTYRRDTVISGIKDTERFMEDTERSGGNTRKPGKKIVGRSWMKDTQMLAKDRKRDSGRSRTHTGRSGRDIGRSRMQKDMQKERGGTDI